MVTNAMPITTNGLRVKRASNTAPALNSRAGPFGPSGVIPPGIVEGIRARADERLPVTMIPNGSDLELFHPSKHARLTLPDLGPDDFVAGFTGAHGVANGLDALLDVAAELRRRGDTRVKVALAVPSATT
jgi:hypothetical protein